MVEARRPDAAHQDDALVSSEEAVAAQLAASSGNAVEDLAYLRLHLGDAFVNWILADPAEQLSPRQAEVTTLVASLLRSRQSDQPELPIELAISSLAFYVPAWGTNSINHFRHHITQKELPAHSLTGNYLLDSLTDLAIESYGELLLPSYTFPSILGSHMMSPMGQKVAAALRESGIFRSPPDSHIRDEVTVDAVDDTAQIFHFTVLGSRIVSAAWELSAFAFMPLLLPRPGGWRGFPGVSAGRGEVR